VPALSYSSVLGRWVVAITVLGSGIAALDAAVVNIVLPTIGRDFHTGIAALQWVMTSYILTMAAFLLIGGSLGDRFGRRRVYLLGVVWFALASAACGFAPNADFLIITRVLQGIGGALLTPGSLAILEASFTPADRARAIAVVVVALGARHIPESRDPSAAGQLDDGGRAGGRRPARRRRAGPGAAERGQLVGHRGRARRPARARRPRTAARAWSR